MAEINATHKIKKHTMSSTNYIRHLAGFFDRVADDGRLSATHVAMYVAIFQLWNINRFQNPVCISRMELMRISKISSKGTYHKCLKELNDYGYFRYEPSHSPLRGSLVYLFSFHTDPKAEEKVPSPYVAPGIAYPKKSTNHKPGKPRTEDGKDYSEPL